MAWLCQCRLKELDESHMRAQRAHFGKTNTQIGWEGGGNLTGNTNSDGVQWPLVQPEHLRRSEWFQLLSAREQEVQP